MILAPLLVERPFSYYFLRAFGVSPMRPPCAPFLLPTGLTAAPIPCKDAGAASFITRETLDPVMGTAEGVQDPDLSHADPQPGQGPV